MFKKSSYVLTILLFLSQTILAGPNHQHQNNFQFNKEWKMTASIKTKDFQKTFKKLSELDIDIAGVDIKEKIIDVLVGDIEYLVLVEHNMEPEITQVKGVTRGPDQKFKNPEEIEQIVTDFATRYPQLTQKISIGKSLEGRDIWALKISDNPELNELEEPTVLFNSMHHAREIMTPEVSIDIIQTLLEGHGTDAKITEYVENNQIYVIPMFNVDGNNKMWNSDKMWRKNTRGGYGVDLNRNYPAGWDKCNGSSGWRSSQTYRGPKPASEPETQAMMAFIKQIRPVFDISYHSYSELVIYPKGCSPERAINADVVEKIGKEIATKLDYAPGTAWELLYNADGGDIDWMYEAYQVIPYVIELNSRKVGFHPNYDKWRDVTVERNRAGWMHLLDRAHQSGVRGSLRQGGNYVSEANIEIYKIENGTETKYYDYLGHESGYFHLVLNPGTYKLKFSKDSQVIGEAEILINNDLARVELDF